MNLFLVLCLKTDCQTQGYLDFPVIFNEIYSFSFLHVS